MLGPNMAFLWLAPTGQPYFSATGLSATTAPPLGEFRTSLARRRRSVSQRPRQLQVVQADICCCKFGSYRRERSLQSPEGRYRGVPPRHRTPLLLAGCPAAFCHRVARVARALVQDPAGSRRPLRLRQRGTTCLPGLPWVP